MEQLKNVYVQIMLEGKMEIPIDIKHRIRSNIRVSNSFITEESITFMVRYSSKEEAKQIAKGLIRKLPVKQINFTER